MPDGWQNMFSSSFRDHILFPSHFRDHKGSFIELVANKGHAKMEDYSLIILSSTFVVVKLINNKVNKL